MGLFSFHRNWVAERWQKEISGKVTFASGSPSGSGKGWSVTDGAGAGEFNVVLDTPVAAEVVTQLAIESTTDDVTVKSEGFTVATKTLKVVVMLTGSPSDTDCVVHFTIKFKSVNV